MAFQNSSNPQREEGSGIRIRDILGEASSLPTERQVATLTASWDGASRRIARNLAENTRRDNVRAGQTLRTLIGALFEARPQDQLNVLSAVMLIYTAIEESADRRSVTRDVRAAFSRDGESSRLGDALRACFEEMANDMPQNIDTPGGLSGALARKLRYTLQPDGCAKAIAAVSAVSCELEDHMMRSLAREVGHIFSKPKLRLGNLTFMENGFAAVASSCPESRTLVVRELITSLHLPPYAQFECQFDQTETDTRYLEYARFVGRTLKSIAKTHRRAEEEIAETLEQQFRGANRSGDDDFRRAVGIAYGSMAVCSSYSTDQAFAFFGEEVAGARARDALPGFLELALTERHRCLDYLLPREFDPLVRFFACCKDESLRHKALLLSAGLLGALTAGNDTRRGGAFLARGLLTLAPDERLFLQRETKLWSLVTREGIIDSLLNESVARQTDGDFVDSCTWAKRNLSVVRGKPVISRAVSRLSEIQLRMPLFEGEPDPVGELANVFRTFRDASASSSRLPAPLGLDR